jgi:hypothetical protein
VVSSLDEENSLRPNLRVRDTDPFAGSLDMVNANRIHEGKTDEKIRECTRFRVPRCGLLSISTSVNHEGCRKMVEHNFAVETDIKQSGTDVQSVWRMYAKKYGWINAPCELLD